MIALGILIVVLVVFGIIGFVVVRMMIVSVAEDEVHRVRNESAVAARRLHDLTRQAFIAMSEEAERRNRP